MTPKEKYEGLIFTGSGGITFKVVEYINSSNVKVKAFIDGLIMISDTGRINKNQLKHPDLKKFEFIGTIWTNNNNEKLVITNYRSTREVDVIFMETNVKATFSMQKIKIGQVKNPIHGNRSPSQVIDVIGKKITNLSGLRFEIIEQNYNLVLVKFENTNTEKWVKKENAMDGKVKDQFHLSVYGEGYLGNYDKSIEYSEKAYGLWHDMMNRCYGSTERLMYYYASTGVSDRWKCFEYFLNDLKSIKGFDMWLNKQGIDLDKDLNGDSTLYSLETCEFMTHQDNLRVKNLKGSDAQGTR